MDERDVRLLTARGPRAAERLLFRELKRLLPGGRAPDLARPVLVLVPSGSLRRQLLRRATRLMGPALVGLEILGPRTLASRILNGMNRPPRGGGEYFDLLVRRAAAEEETLARELDRFDDGYGLCVGSVRDLGSAGAGEVDPEQLAGCLRELPESPEVERARALLRVADRVMRQMSELGLERGGDLMLRAATMLEESEEAWPRCSAILVHGFADAPGLTRRFLRALLGHREARLVLDLPTDPSGSPEETPSARFARRFAASLGLEVGEAIDEVVLPPQLLAFDAVGREAEVRETVWRIAAEIAEGAAPESIALVMRDLAGYAPEIRRQFTELGLPLSGPGIGQGLDPRAEAAAAFAALCARGPTLDLHRFVLLCGAGFAGGAGADPRRDLITACGSLGLADLGALAALDVDRALDGHDSYEIPVGVGLDGEGEDERARKRRLPAAILLEAVATAGRTLDRLGAMPTASSLRDRARALATLAREVLGHLGDDEPIWLSLLDDLTAGPPALEIDGAEFDRLWESAVAEKLSLRLGGRGLGVQVFELAQARGLAFERLHLLGLNARVFPALGREDPLLGDRTREALRAALPDLGLHRERPDEESYLFAQLMGAAPLVTLSWMRADDDGKELARSPFVERLSLASLESEQKARVLETRLGQARERGDRLSARDRQILAALEGRESARLAVREFELRSYLAALPTGLRDSAPDAGLVAAAQGAIVAEIEAAPFDTSRRGRLSPWMGRVGPDPLLARAPLYVTALEAVARCPWQAFLRRALRLERLPDPVASPPDIDALLLGNTVHDALDALMRPLTGLESPPRPTTEVVNEAVATAARERAREAGFELDGLIRVLTGKARPFVERAIALDWASGEGPVVAAVEATRSVEIETVRGESRMLHFRADRIDRDQEGFLATDYKTGKALSDAKKPETRRKHLETAISAGSHLQGPAYALGCGRGRYLYLDPALEDEFASVMIEADAELERRFRLAAEILEGSWAGGLLPPRLESAAGKEPAACEYCEFQAACLRGDSGAKMRLVDLVAAEAAGGGPSALADVWDPAGRAAPRLEEDEG